MQAIIRNLHTIIIVIAIAKLGWTYYDFSEGGVNREAELQKTKADFTQSEKTKKDIKKYLSNIESEKAKIENVAREIEKTQQLLPSEISDSEIINALTRMADDINIKEKGIQPDLDENRGFLIARKYKFRAKATYLQFLILFEKISESKRILNVSEVVFKKLSAPQRTRFQLIDGEFILEAYKYNSSYKEDRGIDQLEKKFTTHEEIPKPKAHKGKAAGGEE